MKRAKSLFDDIVTFDNLRIAWIKARKGKTSTNPVRNFSRSVNENLENIRQRLLSSPVEWSPYHQFKITDPKERMISAVPFSDRVMHHAIMNVLEPVFERQMIYHTYACRKGKGTHLAVRYVRNNLQNGSWFAKLDVRKYFDSINHAVLKKQLCRIIKDARCLELLFSIIDSYGGNALDARGLPIGNLTSQFFANLYLSAFDHFVLETLKPALYCRYMDDMVLLCSSKKDLANAIRQIDEYLLRELCLQLKPVITAPVKNGVPFLGYRIRPSNVRLLRVKLRTKQRKICYIDFLYRSGAITQEKAASRITAVLSHYKGHLPRAHNNVTGGRVLWYNSKYETTALYADRHTGF